MDATKSTKGEQAKSEYYADIDMGQGGHEIFQAASPEAALADAVEWAKGGEWGPNGDSELLDEWEPSMEGDPPVIVRIWTADHYADESATMLAERRLWVARGSPAWDEYVEGWTDNHGTRPHLYRDDRGQMWFGTPGPDGTLIEASEDEVTDPLDGCTRRIPESEPVIPMPPTTDRTANQKIHWSDVEVLDCDGETRLWDEAEIDALREYRRTGTIAGRFLGRVGSPREDPTDASTWGPAVDEIDWTGFPEETEE